MSRLRKILAGRSGEGYIDVAVLILCVMLVLALSVKILPVFIAKQQLDTFAAVLREKTGLNPEIHWSASGRIQLNEEVTVQLTYRYNLGLFGGFGSFPITLRAAATGKSEVYWK